MVIKLFNSSFFFLLVICTPSMLLAEQGKRTALTIEDIVSQVWNLSPEIRALESSVLAARGGEITAKTLTNPILSLTAGNKNLVTNSKTIDGPAGTVSLMQQFEWPGRIALRKAIAANQVELARLGLRQFKFALKVEIISLVNELRVAEERANIGRQLIERYQSVSEVLQQREVAGVIPLLERQIIEASSLSVEKEINQAMLNAQTVKLTLNQLRGAKLDEDIHIVDIKRKNSKLPQLNDLLEYAHANNFELLVKQSELEGQSIQIDLTKNELYPAFSIGPYVALERGGDKETQYGVGLSIPLTLWDRKEGRIKTEEAKRNQASNIIAAAQRGVDHEIAKNIILYKQKQQESKKWSSILTKLKEAADLADQHYRGGSVPVTTYIELQKEYFEASQQLQSIELSATVARTEIERLLGGEIDSVHPLLGKEN